LQLIKIFGKNRYLSSKEIGRAHIFSALFFHVNEDFLLTMHSKEVIDLVASQFGAYKPGCSKKAVSRFCGIRLGARCL
jgi:hypothetical protein